MDLQWNSIRALDGSQQTGFEELCAQLARTETPNGAKFVRKGRPDAGVECFCTLEGGGEWGWQAKYFTAALGASQWAQLDESVKSALEKHPSLVRYYVCAPRDRSDQRREGVTTEMQRWEKHVEKWRGWAGDREMDTDFVWWGSSELQGRLVGLLGLSSLVTAALSATAAIATAAKPDLPPLQLGMILVPLGYIAVQAVAAMLFTLAGLMPRTYPFAPPWDGRTWDQSERLSRHITNLRQSMWSTNRRADHMVLALQSLKRFAWGSAALLGVLVIIILDRRFDLISRLLDFLERVSEG